ncbi:unnamed protein product [Eruca vesicaria subsp. sativa]|uniref:Uncharacterized protein n=1 Tax=Eruca vesicaria subsp. sativa TaxID=29727 RepID=A0ABC8LL62_ERUVS|nr:unnamed protein product [Eruca vesicaria subsp. sativa]
MSQGLDLSLLEELTSNAKQIQEDVLNKILKANANTEYLTRFLEGSSDKELFKKNVPAVSYEDVKPYIDRVANGEPSEIISGEPITALILSSGTSSGNQKIYPANNIYFENMRFGFAISSVIMSKHVDGIKQGKAMRFIFTRNMSKTPCGLPLGFALTCYRKSQYYRSPGKHSTSPGEITICPDAKQSMYCQLLCGLVQRDEVVSVGALYASVLVQAIHFLEKYWKELCSNIRSGHVSEWITDLGCRDSVSIVLGEPNADLADLIENECSGTKPWQGIITRLWPKTKCIEAVITGTMAQYIPALDFYSNKLPLVSMFYGASETLLGINVNPLSKPEDVSYTFLPNLSYFEFIDVDGTTSEIVDLVDVKLGGYYEPLVTNYSGKDPPSLNMSLGCDLSVLEELTSNAKQIQEDVLTKILKANANTEYLSRFLKGSFDKELFKKNVPVVSYEDVKPYIDRVANGEPSDIISGEPITAFLRSSGTSSGNQKIYPINNILFENMLFGFTLSSLVMSKHVDGYKQGKAISFIFTQSMSKTPCGLPLAPALTSYSKSQYYRRPGKRSTSPDEVILCSDTKQSMYCQLLCGLVQRDEVVSVGALYAPVLVQVIHFLEKFWKELASNIRSGHVSEWITDLGCRDSVSAILGEPKPELADLIEKECGKKSWQGIISRLWPKTKCIESVVTGAMAQYIPALEFYSNNLPLVSMFYGSSETLLGINVNPLSKPQDVSYTFLPNMSYFEFIHVGVDGEDTSEIVDLVDVKLGGYYEPLVTNYSGSLHRSRVGDVLQVTGFYNNTPQFRFVRRKNTVLCVDLEPTTEEDILKALARATVVLESSDLILTGFTCYGDISTVPGHYVFYLELKAKVNNGTNVLELDNKVLVEYCCVMEESLSGIYRRLRGKEGSIGALEVRIVQQGTFDSLMEFFVSRGSSMSQYKTPICVNSAEALKVLEDKVLARFFSDRSPPI